MAFPNLRLLGGSVHPGQGVELANVFFDDFNGDRAISETGAAATGFPAGWLKTSVDTNSDGADRALISTDFGPGGWLELIKNDNAADIENLQAIGMPIQIKREKDIYFATRIAIEDVSETNLVIGLASRDTDCYGGMNDFIGFRLDNDGIIDYVAEDDTNETTASTGVTMVDATGPQHAVDLQWWFQFPQIGSARVKFFVNGAEKASVITNVPDVDTFLTPTIENGKGPASVETVFVDYFLVAQPR